MSEWITLARIVRPRGLKGEVIADSAVADPERIRAYPRLRLDPPGRDCRIESAWAHQDRLVLKFEGIDTVEAAESLRDSDLLAPAEDRPPVPEGEHYLGDLIGCAIVDEQTGETLGVVSDCLEYGGPILLEVKGSGPELLIPFVGEICRTIDTKAKRIGVALPAGLREL